VLAILFLVLLGQATLGAFTLQNGEILPAVLYWMACLGGGIGSILLASGKQFAILLVQMLSLVCIVLIVYLAWTHFGVSAFVLVGLFAATIAALEWLKRVSDSQKNLSQTA